MKRDWELIGDIFNAIEDETLQKQLNRLSGEAREDPRAEERLKILCQHIEMLADAGFVKDAEVRVSIDGFYSFAVDHARITLIGYDYADLVKDKTLLHKTVSAIKEAGYMVTWETLKHFTPKLVELAARKFADKYLAGDKK